MKNIVLVGLMGAGKSTVGKALSEKLSFEFLDTDEIITQEQNLAITDIFSQFGENYFRQLEKNLVLKFSDFENKIISTGGGLVQDIENLNNLKKNGFVVYLQASVETLYSRIKDDNKRPLLQVDNPLEKLSEILIAREKNYKLANFIINTENKTIDYIVNELIREYNAQA
jgi:shikimate kinase